MGRAICVQRQQMAVLEAPGGNAWASPSEGRAATSDRLRLVDEHHGNVVADRIAQMTRLTEESGFSFPVLELAFAFRTNKDLEELRRQAHCVRSLGRR